MILAALLLCALAAEEARIYHPVSLIDLALGKVRQTHVLVKGFVTYVKREADGDLHIRLCDSIEVKDMQRGRCIVVEQIPALPILKLPPRHGSCIVVSGIARFDKENGHRWNEIHPLEMVSPCR